MTSKALWRCPTCSREFAKQGQSHSCHPVSVHSHFAGKAESLKALFEHLCSTLGRFGPLRIDAVKSSINLAPKHHMGGVRVLNDRLHIGFVLNRRIENPRILRTEQLGPSTYLHVIALANAADLDRELLLWLKEAYQRAAA